jgi:hypothetical protein
MFNIKIRKTTYMFRASSGHHQTFSNTMKKYFTRVLYIGMFSPLELKNLLLQIVEINALTWIEIVLNVVLQRGIYGDIVFGIGRLPMEGLSPRRGGRA